MDFYLFIFKVKDGIIDEKLRETITSDKPSEEKKKEVFKLVERLQESQSQMSSMDSFKW
jgi:hypothetical protein